MGFFIVVLINGAFRFFIMLPVKALFCSIDDQVFVSKTAAF